MNGVVGHGNTTLWWPLRCLRIRTTVIVHKSLSPGKNKHFPAGCHKVYRGAKPLSETRHARCIFTRPLFSRPSNTVKFWETSLDRKRAVNRHVQERSFTPSNLDKEVTQTSTSERTDTAGHRADCELTPRRSIGRFNIDVGPSTPVNLMTRHANTCILEACVQQQSARHMSLYFSVKVVSSPVPGKRQNCPCAHRLLYSPCEHEEISTYSPILFCDKVSEFLEPSQVLPALLIN